MRVRLLKRNLKTVNYCMYKGEKFVEHSYDYDDGEPLVLYENAVPIEVNVSPARGDITIEQFGNSLDYDKVMVTDDMSCPIDEHTVLFVDKAPEYDAEGSPLYDYIVMKVAKSLNCISYAISKVKIS